MGRVLSSERIRLQCRRLWFDSWVGKIHWRRDELSTLVFLGFPGDSDSKESTCNVGDLGWEDPLKKETATHASILAGEFHGQRSLAGYSPWGHKELYTTESLSLSPVKIRTKVFYLG